MANKGRILMIDGDWLAHRCYYMLENIKTSKGLRSGLVFGFLRTLKKLHGMFFPHQMVACFASKTNKLKLEFKDYKSNRGGTPNDYLTQRFDLEEMLRLLKITSLSVEGLEADHIIAALAGDWSIKGYSITIISGDKDFLQVVDDSIVMYDDYRKELWDVENTVKKWKGVRPQGICDIKSLLGDGSDNIAGIMGVGPVYAPRIVKMLLIAIRRCNAPETYPLLNSFLYNQKVHDMFYKIINRRIPDKIVASIFSDEGKKKLTDNLKMIYLPKSTKELEADEKDLIYNLLLTTPSKVGIHKIQPLLKKYELYNIAKEIRTWVTWS